MAGGGRKGLAIVFLGAAAVLGWYGYRHVFAVGPNPQAPGSASSPQAVPVAAVTVGKKDIPVYLDGLGTVQAYNSVVIRTQIDGQLEEIAFREGQEVKKGDLLARIDARPFQAQLDQAQAKLKQDQGKLLQDQAKVKQDETKVREDRQKVEQDKAKKAQDEATLVNARRTQSRLEEAYKASAVTLQSVDDQRTLVKQIEATIAADEAAIKGDEVAVEVDQAQIVSDEAVVKADEGLLQSDEAAIRYAQTQIAYTKITSPIDGRVGVRLVDSGNVVHPNDVNGIALVTQLQPISVTFTLPQQDLVIINDRMAQAELPVLAIDSSSGKELDRGTLALIDNQIDQTTGTIKLKSTFQNSKRSLWPGGFVNVRLLLNTMKDAITLPAQAIQQGPSGTFVYAITPDQTVEVRAVKVIRSQDGEAVIESGVAPGDQVVLSGQDRLKPGAKVTIGKPGGKTESSDKPSEKGAAREKKSGKGEAKSEAGGL
jgi:multidrug efflux system membrane fusion protein